MQAIFHAQFEDISIHAPRTGSDFPRGCFCRHRMISIHAPRTGSDFPRGCFCRHRMISIHAPRTGSDKCLDDSCIQRRAFQSTLPARGATQQNYKIHLLVSISIHAPRTGSDLMQYLSSGFFIISIHAPRTGSDFVIYCTNNSPTISIHAPRTGSDDLLATSVESLAIFQSTLPARGATQHRPPYARNYRDFNPRSPHGERRKRF